MGKKSGSKKTSETPRLDAFNAARGKYLPLVPADELTAMEKSLSQPLLQAFRLNPLKTNETVLTKMAVRYGWDLERISFCPEGWRVRSADILPSMTSEHWMGHYYIQDSASMMPVTLYDPQQLAGAPMILDLAASPGGKTTHLIGRSMDRGLVIANDSSASRIPALKKVLKNWGSIGHAITQFPGESFGEWFPDTFDLILLDAPCSMQSLVSLDSHPMRPISEREEKALAQRQTALLQSALRALRPGGQIVYSTCTLSPDEDEGVVDQILQTFRGMVQVLDAAMRIPWPAPGLTVAGDRIFDPSLAGAVRLWPHRYQTAGFFACLLEKTDSFGFSPEMAPCRDWEKSSFSVPGKEEIEALQELLAQLGLDLDGLCAEHRAVICRRGNELWMLPERYLELFPTLPSKSIGMRMAFTASGGWIPDNEWCSRFFPEMNGFGVALTDEQVSEWLHGADIRPDVALPAKGSIVLMKDGADVFIGCGRVSGDRVRNFNK